MVRLFQFMGLAAFSALISLASSAPVARQSSDMLYQFSTATTLENLAVRQNSQILFTVTSAPDLYNIDPTQSAPEPQLIHSFANANGLTGITELQVPDTFAVVAGNWSGFAGVPGSFGVWRVDLRTGTPQVSIIAAIPEALSLNGATLIPNTNTVLVADSAPGLVWAVNANTGSASVAIEDEMFGSATSLGLGINGIKTRQDASGLNLHFTNSARGIYGTILINSNGSSAGAVQELATLPSGVQYDDFALDSNGNAFIATHPNTVYQVSLTGEQTLFSNFTSMVQPTSASFGGQYSSEADTLYVVTSETTGGQLFALTVPSA